MSHPEGSSLLDFVDAPVIVGDPDCQVIYVNPSCERRLGIAAAAVRGMSMASLFEGGSREAVLKAVAEVCAHGQTSHFKVREEGHSYLVQASPIEAEGDRVGVVILMTDEPASSPPIRVLSAQLAEPVEETVACLHELAAATSDPAMSDAIERGLAALGRLQKFGAEAKEPQPEPPSEVEVGDSQPTLDPARVARRVVERMSGELAGCDVDLLIPQQLPAVQGEAAVVEGVLVEMIRHCIRQAGENSRITFSARAIGRPGRQSLLFSIVHLSEGEGTGGDFVTEPAPRQIRDRIEGLGGSLYAIASDSLGRVISIQLPLAG